MADDPVRGKPTAARFALAANIKHLMDNYSKGFAVGLTPVELEKGCGVSAKTIKRIVNPYSDISPNLESIDLIAAFFRVDSWELLRPRPAQPVKPWAEITNPIPPGRQGKLK